MDYKLYAFKAVRRKGLGYHNDTSKAKRILGWTHRSARETVLDTAVYLIKNKVV